MALSYLNLTGQIYVGETLFVGIDWEGKIPSTVALASGSTQVLDEDDVDVTGTVITGVHTISGFLSVAKMNNVTAGKVYRVFNTTQFDNGEIWIQKITITAVALS